MAHTNEKKWEEDEGCNMSIVDMVESQVIAAIQTPENIQKAIDSPCNVAFLLTGDLFTMGDYVAHFKQAEMKTFIHLDFIEGIANDKSGVQYVARTWKPDGIITTKNHLIKIGKDEGLKTIQRMFLIDRSGVEKGLSMMKSSQPDAMEVLPGIMPRVIDELAEKVPVPLIAGGLIRTQEEILASLQAGALATSVGDPSLWHLGI